MMPSPYGYLSVSGQQSWPTYHSIPITMPVLANNIYIERNNIDTRSVNVQYIATYITIP